MNIRLITACALAMGLALSGTVAVAQDRSHHSFNDNDRQATREWYQQHQRHLGPGWRQRDRLSPAMQARLRNGQRLDPQLRRRIHWLPADLSRRYRPAPRGYRYAMIGGNVVMLDGEYGVHDVFSINLQF
jgi:Ni/Co efflux regulator RcnB